MLRTLGWTGLRLAVVALTASAIAGQNASASSLDSLQTVNSPMGPSYTTQMVYDTSVTIGPTGIDGTNVISFAPVTSGSFTTPSAFSLGKFVVAPLPDSVTTSYDKTPFSISYGTRSINGTEMTSPSLITITGFLNGSITGASQSDVVATFDPIQNPTFETGDFVNTISILDPQVSLVPSTTNDGQTTAQGYMVTRARPVPEPTSIAVFLAALVGGLGMRRRFRPSAV